MNAVSIDLTDVNVFATGKHYDLLARLRQDDPVFLNRSADGTDFWALTRYDDVLWAYRNHEIFSSACGAIVGGSYRNQNDTASNKMLVASDLPRHKLLKQVIHPAFSDHMAQRVSTQVGDLISRAFSRLLSEGGADFATDIAVELPAGALMVLMGLSHAEAHELIHMTRRMVGYRDDSYVDLGTDERIRLVWLQANIYEFFEKLLARRRKSPGDDFVSLLLRARINDRPLTEEEIFFNCLNFAVGGNETSSYTASTGVLALIENPAQYERLCSEPDLMESAVNEILRWSSTNAYVQRVATKDVERHGICIREGDSVTLWNAAANRDERQFSSPDVFDVRRAPNRHLTYGNGRHRCIGVPVAQTELSRLFEHLVRAGVKLAVDGDVRRLRSNFILGITNLPVSVEGVGRRRS